MSVGHKEQKGTTPTVFHESSASSEEDWGDNEEWEVGAIVDEHANTRGKIQYKVVWKGWARQDGSDWTWERERSVTMRDLSIMVKDWKERQSRSLYLKVHGNPSIPPFHLYSLPERDVLNAKRKKRPAKRYAFTELTDQAWKMAVDLKYQRSPLSSKSLAFAPARFSEMRAQRERELREERVHIQQAVSERLCGLGQMEECRRVTPPEWRVATIAVSSDSLISNPRLIPARNPHEQQFGLSLSAFPNLVTERDRELIPVVSNLRYPSHTRRQLEMLWSTRAREEGAAPIFIVNDVNDEEIPMLDPREFIYLESQYLYNVSNQPPDDGFMQSCECRTCNVSSCSCQDDSEILDEEEGRTFAYSGGLYTFPALTNYVVECNKKCQCDDNCPSRVAQRPRPFPIQIFRTEKCGWGVRSTVSLPKGSVLGVYTGELCDRKITSSHVSQRANYIFNLDFHEEVRDSSSGYAVDAYNCGNWTRFVNHSCDPVCSLYPVVWNSVPMLHQPKLAFVANRDIPAEIELTIDYCPQARKGKGMARTKAPNTPDCKCGAKSCRGFIYLE